MPYYHLYELNHAAMSPMRAAADMTRLYFQNPLNPLSHTTYGRSVAAACELLERTTRRYGKPEFGLKETSVGGMRVPVREQVVWQRPFCNLVHFERLISDGATRARRRDDPKLLIVAPMSGHYATLLRGTVEAFMPRADVYVTDWIDARMVPIADGAFDLDDYIDYVISMLHFLGPDTHVLAVCQPSVPVLAAVALMEGRNDPYAPATMTLMGGPIDTRINPTVVNDLAQSRGIDWFERNVIMQVPFPHAGFMRNVYPGFLQLSGFMSMNMDRHVIAHRDFFQHLVEGDGDNAEKHREFYDEYLAVMDLAAEFYLQTVKTVFIEHALPEGKMFHRSGPIECHAIRSTALMTVEGEKDDITGRGQTKAAHSLCTSLPADKKVHYEQPSVGHYGVFNGSRFRAEIAPRIMDFILSNRRRETEIRPFPGNGAAKGNGKAHDAADGAQTPRSEPSDPLAAILLARPQGVADDLKRISGVGPKLETVLNKAGIFHFWQIAQLSDEQIAALDDRLDFRGRIARDNWIGQARSLSEQVES